MSFALQARDDTWYLDDGVPVREVFDMTMRTLDRAEMVRELFHGDDGAFEAASVLGFPALSCGASMAGGSSRPGVRAHVSADAMMNGTAAVLEHGAVAPEHVSCGNSGRPAASLAARRSASRYEAA